MKRLVFILSVFLVLIGLIFIPNIIISKDKTSALILINSKKLEKQINSNTSSYFIYIGRPTCPYCNEFKPELEKAISNNKNNFYYFNTDEHREEESFEEVLTKLNVTRVPILIYMNKGKIIDSLEYDEGSSEKEIKNWINNITKSS